MSAIEQQRTVQLAFEAGIQLGMAKRTLLLEKLSLQAANMALEIENTQLKLTHQYEFQVLNHQLFASREAIAERIKGLVVQVKVFQVGCNETTTFSSDLGLIMGLVNLTERKAVCLPYPEYRQRESLTDEESTPNCILNLPARFQEEMALIEKEVGTLRRENRTLLQQREERVRYHLQVLEAKKRAGIGELNELLSKIRSLFDQIKWDTLAVTNSAFIERFPTPLKRIYQERYQTGLKVEVQKIQDQMQLLIKMIERER